MRKEENPAGRARREARECPWKYTREKGSPIRLGLGTRRLYATRTVTSTRVARLPLEARPVGDQAGRFREKYGRICHIRVSRAREPNRTLREGTGQSISSVFC